MGEASEPLKPSPTRIVRGLIVVARDQPHLWESLTRHFERHEDVQIILDRRRSERRQTVRVYASDRRKADRRRPLSEENDLRFRSFLIVAR